MNRERRRERKNATALSNFDSLELYIGRGENVGRKNIGEKRRRQRSTGFSGKPPRGPRKRKQKSGECL
jgi:hypothetical protein